MAKPAAKGRLRGDLDQMSKPAWVWLAAVKRSAVISWALVGGFLLAAMVDPRRWLDDGLRSALVETVALAAIGGLFGALAAVSRSWLAKRRKPD